MKFKINWGTGIVIAMVLFMVFILQYVYRVSVYEKYDHHLVADDYYKDELNYQKKINKEINANALKENVKLLKTDKGLEIIFPDIFNFQSVTGAIKMLRPSNYRLDIKRDIKLSSNSFLIKDEVLATGQYNVFVEWSYNGKDYLFKSSLYY
jgi:hypothetical protein